MCYKGSGTHLATTFTPSPSEELRALAGVRGCGEVGSQKGEENKSSQAWVAYTGICHWVSCGKYMGLGSKKEAKADLKGRLILQEEKPHSSIPPPSCLTLGHIADPTSFHPPGGTAERGPNMCPKLLCTT